MPKCPKKRKLPVKGRLLGEADFEHIFQQVDLERNKLTKASAARLAAGSNKPLEFICRGATCEMQCEHRWKVALVSRTSSGNGCPYCSNFPRKVCRCNSLAIKAFPAINKRNIFWDKENNDAEKRDPFQLAAKARTSVNWICKNITCERGCIHKFKANIINVVNNHGCPYCASTHKKVCPCHSISAHFADFAKRGIFWNQAANDLKGLDPVQLSQRSSQPAVWNCDKITCEKKCLHSWEAPIENVTNLQGCPHCARKAFCSCHILQNHLEKLKQRGVCWDEEKNNLLNLFPSDFFDISTDKVWWKCDALTCDMKCTHSWKASIKYTVHESAGCYYCTGHRLCSCRSLITALTRLKTRNIEWFEKRNDDLKLDPTKLNDAAKQNAWWKCGNVTCTNDSSCDKKCEHLWFRSIASVTLEATGCPYCKEPKQRFLCPSKMIGSNLALIEKRGIFWDEEANEQEGRSLWTTAMNSLESAHFFCKKTLCEDGCSHRWKSRIVNVFTKSGCVFCCVPAQQICECNSVSGRYPAMVNACWDWETNDSNQIFPWKLSVGSGISVAWKCKKCGHRYPRRIADQTNRTNRFCSNCPLNLSAAEQDVKDVLERLAVRGIVSNIETQKTFPFLIYIQKLRLDFYFLVSILQFPVVIEVDGKQHFGPWNYFYEECLLNWLTSVKRDFKKNESLKVNKMHLLRISYRVRRREYENELLLFFNEAKALETKGEVLHKYIKLEDYEKQQEHYGSSRRNVTSENK